MKHWMKLHPARSISALYAIGKMMMRSLRIRILAAVRTRCLYGQPSKTIVNLARVKKDLLNMQGLPWRLKRKILIGLPIQ